jgi:hypothetical protein
LLATLAKYASLVYIDSGGYEMPTTKETELTLVSYDIIRGTELWDLLPSNRDLDKAADRLAAVIEAWLDAEVLKEIDQQREARR